MVLILPDSSVLIPYLVQRTYAERIERQLRLKRLILCSVVAEEIMAGARDQIERRRYNMFFAQFQTARLIVTPADGVWRTCGHILSRYRERYGAIQPRDHQNDVLIMLTAIQLAQEQETVLVTENDSDFMTWLDFVHDRARLRIEAVRR